MKIWAAVLSFAFVVNGGVAIAQEAGGEPYVQAFCSLRTADWGRARIYLLSPSLTAAVTEAQERNDKLQAERPDEKPPLGDGVPYQSQPDVAPECEPGASAREGEAIVAEVVYSFPDEPSAGWTDRLVLVEAEDGSYVVDDIRYGTQGDEDTLRSFLERAFDNS